MWILLMDIGILLLAASGYYINYRYVKKFSDKFAAWMGIYGTIACIYAAGILIYYAITLSDFHEMRLGFFVFLLFTIPSILFILYWLIAVFPFIRFHRFRDISTLVGITLATIVFFLILYGGLIGRKKLILKEVQIEFARLPESFDGIRILQFSDIHLGSFKGDTAFIRTIKDRINSLNADIVLFTGDAVNVRTEETTEFMSVLPGIQARYGVYSVLGNHDYGDYVEWPTPQDKTRNLQQLIDNQRQWGWIVVYNDNRHIHIGQDSIAIVGVGNWGKPPFKRYGDLQKAYRSVDPETFAILLSHDPDHWQEEVVPTTGIDLMLAGHTHAWQLRFGNVSPSSLMYNEWAGLYRDGDQYLYVNQGLGSIMFPMRIGAYPELTLIELRKKY